MNIIHFKKFNYITLLEPDSTLRDIGYSFIDKCKITGRNSYYPNVLIYQSDDNILISPYDEKVMSLNKESFYDNNIYEFNINLKSKEDIEITVPVFFFIYNFDNYYHYLYDTLPYLYTYLELKKTIPNLKILVNYPNKFKNEFYRFNIEFLQKIINVDDLLIHQDNYIFSRIYISTSLTHGGYSNNPPRIEINTIYDLVVKNTIRIDNLPKKIYISRRTWLNPDKTNIGTDYTTRRKMINEDELVNQLMLNGFVEIFAENLCTDEKINLFANAEIIIGSIGGGMANLLFSSKKNKAIVFVTPYFLDINYRFKYSLENSDIIYFNNTCTYKELNNIPLFCRVKIKSTGQIGEIIEYIKNKYLINLSDNDVAGFNNIMNYKQILLDPYEFDLLDNGLNSPYIIDIGKLFDLL